MAPSTTQVGTRTPEIAAIVRDVLGQLPDEQAHAFVHYHLDGMTHAEIAEVLGCSRRHVGNLFGTRGNQAARTKDRVMNRREVHISDLRWDWLLAGKLSNKEQEEIRAHAKQCLGCRKREQELTAQRDAFAKREFTITHERPRRLKGWTWGPVAVLAAAAATLLMLRMPTSPIGLDDGVRVKGSGIQLLRTRGRPGALEPLATGDTIHPGDYPQAGYSANQDGFCAVFSRDGAGEAFSNVPSTGESMVPLPAGKERSFPESTVLDHVVGSEIVVLLWCDADHSLQPMLDALHLNQSVVAPLGYEKRELLLNKRGAP